MIIAIFLEFFFLKLWQEVYFLESSTYIKPSKYDNIYVLIEWWNICQITVNDLIIIVLSRNEFSETYILSNGHETCQSYNDQIIMKHMYMCINLWSWTFVWIFTCMLSRQTLKLGYLDTTYVFSGEVETLSCYRSDPIIMKFLWEQFVLKLCQIDNLCQSWGKLKLLLMKINFTFSGGQKLRIFGRSWNFLRSQFWNLNKFSETLSE